MSKNTVGLKRLTSTSSGQIRVGEPLSLADKWDYELHTPGIKDARFGLVKIISSTIRVRTYVYEKRKKAYTGLRKYVLVQCVKCRSTKWISFDNLSSGKAKGCRSCLQPRRFPQWLYQRVSQAQQRCCNSSHPCWEDYGGRGVQFLFPSVAEACQWILDNIGLPLSRKMELDRIENEGHYEPGNLRWSTRRQNCAHTRRCSQTPRMHRFRILHPDVRYADETLIRFFIRGMTPEEIVKRWKSTRQRCGNRPCGIFSTPDLFIASQCKDF